MDKLKTLLIANRGEIAVCVVVLPAAEPFPRWDMEH